MHGFIVIDKPSGVTSFSMIGLVRRLTGMRRVGHAGTLDPLATGVLPVAVGQATRFIEYMDDAPKTYRATVRFGAATDTYDAEGAVTATGDASVVTDATLRAALDEFTGDIEQMPPSFSALKVQGRPMYSYAREGRPVDAKPRRVRIDSIDLLGYAGDEAEIEVTCGKGTYIRSLAHDLGVKLGCGAHLAALRRTASGGFSIDDARRPDELIAIAAEDRLGEALLAPDRAVERRPAAVLSEAHSADVLAGRLLILTTRADAPLCRAYAESGDFLGLLSRRAEGDWKPHKVLSNTPFA